MCNPTGAHQTRGARPVAALLDRLEGVREVAPGRWRAKCPAHEGHRPALAVTETADGTVLMHCFAGCSVAEVAAALDVNLADLFPHDGRDVPDAHRSRPVRHPFVAAQMLPALTLELFEVVVIAGAILRRGSMTATEHARLLRSVARIMDAERCCHD